MIFSLGELQLTQGAYLGAYLGALVHPGSSSSSETVSRSSFHFVGCKGAVLCLQSLQGIDSLTPFPPPLYDPLDVSSKIS